MGINNLLKFMKPHVQSVHIKKYAGKRVGIDAYSWLHKGAYSCSMELCLNSQGENKFQYMKYFMHRIHMLQHYEITPVVVFDGGSLPCKSATEDERHRRRKCNLDMAMEKLKDGDVNAASELFQKAVSITPLMAHQLIQILRSENIEFVVAPYEADAQLAYLSGIEESEGGIAAIISEDSDLLAYGCPAVVFKMDKYGNGDEILLDEVLNAVGGVVAVPSFKNFDKDLFTGMCVLAGCDFLPSVPGVGITKAYNLVAKYRNLSRVLSVLRFEKGKQMPEDYATAFKEAISVFQHARVYDAVSKQLKTLKPIPKDFFESQDEELDFLGPVLFPSLAISIAEGNLDPCTMEPFDHITQMGNHPSIQHTSSLFSSQEENTESTQESCFTIVSCHKTTKRRIKGDKPPANIVMEKVLNPSEVSALQKLVFSSKNEASREKKNASIRFATDIIPNNNPFKKRKVDQVQLNHVSVVDQQHSVVTEIVHVAVESQQSVDSKASNGPKSRNKSEKLLKMVQCNQSDTKKNSILNFF